MRALLLNGVVVGSIYGLVAFGLTLVYKKSRVLNFANAEAGMMGAFVFYALSVEVGLHYLVAATAGTLVSGAIGGLSYLVLRGRRHDALAMLIGTLAIAGVLQFIALEVWGSTPYFVPPPLASVTVGVLGFTIAGPRLIVLLVALALAVAFFAVFRYTKAGLLFRASAIDSYAAELMGVNVFVIDLVTWTVAGLLAGVAAILVAPLVGFHVFFMTLLAVRGFAAALLARMTNVAASLGAALVVGFAEAVLTRATTSPGVPEACLVLVIVGLLVLWPPSVGRATA